MQHCTHHSLCPFLRCFRGTMAAAAASASSTAADESVMTVENRKFSFAQFFESGAFSDIRVLHDGRSYALHKIVLCNKSGFFRKLIMQSDFSGAEYELKMPDPSGLLPDVLRFMYSGEIRIEKDAIVSLLRWAEDLNIVSLKKAIGSKLADLVGPQNALDVLLNALQYEDSEHIVNACCGILSKNFVDLENSVMGLPVDVVLRVLRQPTLTVRSEEAFLSSVKALIASRAFTPEQRTALLGTVAFRDLSHASLRALLASGAVDALREQVYDALVARIRMLDAGRAVAPLHARVVLEWTWDATVAPASIKVLKKPDVVEKSGNDNAVVRTTQPLPPTGQHYWEVMFYHAQPGYSPHCGLGTCYYVGVVHDTGGNISYTDCMADSSDGWGLHDNNANQGEKRHNSRSRAYGLGYGERDRVGVLVDMDAHTMSFFVKGVACGVAFSHLPSDHLYPAITIYNDQVRCRIKGKPAPLVAGGERS